MKQSDLAYPALGAHSPSHVRPLYCARQKLARGFATGDIVRALVPSGKEAGTRVGRAALHASGSFNIQTARGAVPGIHAQHCTVIHRRNGYGYYGSGVSSPDVQSGVSAPGVP